MYRKHEWEKQIKGGHFSKYTLEAKRYMKNGLEYKDYWYRTHLSLDELYGEQRMDFQAPGPLVEELIEQKILINAFGRLGNSAVLNGILCSNMSFGAIIIFAAWWIVLLRLRVRNMEEQSE